MLNREFTFREKILMVACLALAVGLFYYQFVHKGIRQQMREYSTETLQMEIETEEAKAAKIAEMEHVIANSENKVRGNVAVYNNLAAEISFVGAVTNRRASNVSLSWSNPVLNGTTVRRGVRVSFNTTSYNFLKQILQSFNESPYRCIIYDLSLSDNSPSTRTETITNADGTTTSRTINVPTGIQNSTQMSVSFSATFFETVEGASTMEGLIIERTAEEEETLSSEIADRAHAYD